MLAEAVNGRAGLRELHPAVTQPLHIMLESAVRAEQSEVGVPVSPCPPTPHTSLRGAENGLF